MILGWTKKRMAFVKKWGMTSFCFRAFTLQINVTYCIILTFTHFLLPYKINEMDPITSLVYSIALIIQYTLYKINIWFWVSKNCMLTPKYSCCSNAPFKVFFSSCYKKGYFMQYSQQENWAKFEQEVAWPQQPVERTVLCLT